MVDKNKFAEEDALGYTIAVVGRHTYVTDAMRQYVLEKLSKLERFHNHIIDVQVTMDIQKAEHIVSILLHFSHYELRVQATSSDMYASIDKAVHKLTTQLRRWKSRLQEQAIKPLQAIDMKVNVLSAPYNEIAEYNKEIEGTAPKEVYRAPAIIGNDTMKLKTLTEEEAMMKLELSAHPFLLFRSEIDHEVKLIYRRPDGNYGIVHPELS